MSHKIFFKTRTFLSLLLLLLIGLSVLFLLVIQGRRQKNAEIMEKEKIILMRNEDLIKQQQKKEHILQVFVASDLRAESILVQEIGSQEFLYEKNYKKKQPVASLTKIATAIVVLRDTDIDQVVIDMEDLYQEGEYFLRAGETFEKEDLITFMLINSSNDAARALSSQVTTSAQGFVTKMNDLALELKLDATFFLSDTGLDVTSSVGGSYSNVEDIHKLITYFYQQYSEIAKKTSFSNQKICSDTICHQVENTNILLLERGDIIFSKTGYTNLAGGNLGVIAKVNNKSYSIIVLNSTKEKRFTDVSKIIDNLYEIDKF